VTVVTRKAGIEQDPGTIADVPRPAIDDSRRWRERTGPVRGHVPPAVTAAVAAARDELLQHVQDDLRADLVAEIRAANDELRAIAELEQAVVRRTGGEIQRALGRLRSSSTLTALLRRAPGELQRAAGFTRAMISRIDRSTWVPLLPPAGLDRDADALRAQYGADPALPMQHRLIEADVVRRRAPALVEDAPNNPRCDAALVRLIDTDGYVVAPIVSGRRVVGLLHADRRGQQVPMAPQDLEAVQVFARHVGILSDRAAMADELVRRHDDIARRVATMTAELSTLATGELLLLPPAASDVWRAELENVDHTVQLPPASAVTAREREILALLASGATNAMIAQRLVISENTVKTHVARAGRKLGARSRAECVARWLQIVGTDG
jgi:DNA-binding CsgD family transcriptional regulator/GAF domain-containing protein